MTLLNWELAPQHVMILSDTLALDDQDHRAGHFTTKIYPAPHIGAVITGTGISQVITQFYQHVLGMIVNDVVHLTEFAPSTLREIWKHFKDQLPEGTTTTAYTFGLSEDDDVFTGFAYRSTADFEPHLLQRGMAVKPALAIEEMQGIDSLEAFVALCQKQQAQDRALPRMERVGIGGDLWTYLLRKSDSGALSLKIERIQRMQHYDQDHQIMLAKLPANADHPFLKAALASDP